MARNTTLGVDVGDPADARCEPVTTRSDVGCRGPPVSGRGRSPWLSLSNAVSACGIWLPGHLRVDHDWRLQMDWRESFGEEDARRWAEAFAGQVVVDRDGERIRAAGACPRCGHQFSFDIADEGVLPEAPQTRGAAEAAVSEVDWSGPVTFRTWCACTEGHSNRPSKVDRGCGWNAAYRDIPDPVDN